MPRKELRQKYISKGLCANCGGRSIDPNSKSRCKECVLYMKKISAKRRASGDTQKERIARKTRYLSENRCTMCGRTPVCNPNAKKWRVCEMCYLKDVSNRHFGTIKHWGELKELFKQQNGKCWYTGQNISLNGHSHLEHLKSKHNHKKRNWKVNDLRWSVDTVNQRKGKKDEVGFLKVVRQVAIYRLGMVDDISPDLDSNGF